MDSNNRASTSVDTLIHTHTQCYSYALALCPILVKVLRTPSMGHWLLFIINALQELVEPAV